MIEFGGRKSGTILADPPLAVPEPHGQEPTDASGGWPATALSISKPSGAFPSRLCRRSADFLGAMNA